MPNFVRSDSISIMKVDNNHFVAWNHFMPQLLILNNSALRMINNINKYNINNNDKYSNAVSNSQIEELITNGLIFEQNNGSARDNFIKSLNDNYLKAKNNIHEYFDNRKPFTQLYINNNLCNLNCSYCITKYKSKPIQKTSSFDNNQFTISVFNIIDQFAITAIENKLSPISLCFNGGEMLVEWEFIKSVIERIARKYSGYEAKYSINTNMTLMTTEIAKYMSKHKFTVHLSIDGYRDAHNKTRRYKNGKGSFDDVIKGYNIFRKYNKEKSILGFQGTIEYSDDFEPDKVFGMHKYGFKSCRLAPNLLNVTEEDAKKKAIIMESLIKKNLNNEFKVTDTYINNMETIFNMQNYNNKFNCVGLGCIPNIGLNLNITKRTVSCLCGFVENASVSIDSINNNIYDPKIGEAAIKFIYERNNAIVSKCIECEIIGACRGGCILKGLDLENKINPAGCAYQKIMWKKLIKILYECRNKIKT